MPKKKDVGKQDIFFPFRRDVSEKGTQMDIHVSYKFQL